MTFRRPLLAAALAALAGCGSLDSVPSDAVETCSQQTAPGVAPTDILFVIDDSPSMEAEQALLRAGLYDFIQALAASPIPTDLHIGVTTTSVVQWSDEQATYVTGPSAGIPYPAGTIIAVARDGAGDPVPGQLVYASGAFGGSRLLASGQPALVSDFQANVLVGVDGSQREQPFRAARGALEKAVPGGANDGFLRPGARLAIVFLSDEDDCSGPSDASITSSAGCRAAKSGGVLAPVADYAAYFKGPIAGEVRDVVVAAIVGVAQGSTADAPVLSCGSTWCTDNSCSTASDEGARFVQLLEQFAADHRQLASICDSSFGAALLGFADVIMPDTLPLEGAPADYQMLVPSIDRPGVGTIPCPVALAGTDAAAAARSVYTPPQEGRPATLTFQHECAIQRGDVVNVNIICAG